MSVGCSLVDMLGIGVGPALDGRLSLGTELGATLRLGKSGWEGLGLSVGAALGTVVGGVLGAWLLVGRSGPEGIMLPSPSGHISMKVRRVAANLVEPIR